MSKKYPIPVSNKKIEIYQQGQSSAIGLSSGATSSSAVATTDGNGHFQIVFTPGISSFLLFSGANAFPFTFGSAMADTSYPHFSRTAFPDTAYDPLIPIYIAKIIDSAIIKVHLTDVLIITDTIGIVANTMNGVLKSNYTGLAASAGNTIVLDTIYNMLLTEFDGMRGGFKNSLYSGRQQTTTIGNTLINGAMVFPQLLTAGDEEKVEMLFYLSRQ